MTYVREVIDACLLFVVVVSVCLLEYRVVVVVVSVCLSEYRVIFVSISLSEYRVVFVSVCLSSIMDELVNPYDVLSWIL